MSTNPGHGRLAANAMGTKDLGFTVLVDLSNRTSGLNQIQHLTTELGG